jgi:hypothetical protein
MESDATPLGLKGEHEALLSIARRLQAIIRSPGPPPDSDLARIEEDLVRALAEARISLRRTSRGPRTTSKKTGEYTP